MKLSSFASIAALALGILNLRQQRSSDSRTMKTIKDLDALIDQLETTVSTSAADIQAAFDDLKAKLAAATQPPAEMDLTPEYDRIQAALDKVHGFDPGPIVSNVTVEQNQEAAGQGAVAPAVAATGHARDTGLHVDAEVSNPVDFPAAGGPVPTVSTIENAEPHPATEFPNSENPTVEAGGTEPAPTVPKSSLDEEK